MVIQKAKKSHGSVEEKQGRRTKTSNIQLCNRTQLKFINRPQLPNLQQRLHYTIVGKAVFLIHSIGYTGYRYVKASFYQPPPPPAILLWGADTDQEGKTHTTKQFFSHTYTHTSTWYKSIHSGFIHNSHRK